MNEFKAEDLKYENKDEIITLFLKKDQLVRQAELLKIEATKVTSRIMQLLNDRKEKNSRDEEEK